MYRVEGVLICRRETKHKHDGRDLSAALDSRGRELGFLT